MNHQQLQEALDYQFKRPDLLELALSHTSYANEQGRPQENNERLEFLGDAVLELCVSEELFVRFPEVQEGQLTSFRAMLVSAPSLARMARQLELDRYIRLGKGEETQGGRNRDSILSDCFESVIGAVFLDAGYARVRACIRHLFRGRWPKQSAPQRPRDYKSRLQELTQQLHQDRPRYMLADSSGPEHEKVYRIQVHLPEGTVLEAEATSIKKAEQKAARAGYLLLSKDLDESGA